MEKYKIAVIDDNKDKLDLIINDFEFYEPPFETIEVVIDDKKWTKEEVVKFLKNEKIDAVVTDYLLTSRNNGVDYNGDKIIQELLLQFRNLPIIMISDFAQEAENSDINPFLFIERSNFAENSKQYIDKIYKTITMNKKMIAEYENEIIKLLEKSTLNDDEKVKLVKLDNFLEETFLYESCIPSYYKDNNLVEELNENIKKLDQILEQLNNE